jgi:hypothetical protein
MAAAVKALFFSGYGYEDDRGGELELGEDAGALEGDGDATGVVVSTGCGVMGVEVVGVAGVVVAGDQDATGGLCGVSTAQDGVDVGEGVGLRMRELGASVPGSVKSSRFTSRQLLQAAEICWNWDWIQSAAARTPVLAGRSVSRLERVERLLNWTRRAMVAWIFSGETWARAAAMAGSTGAAAMGRPAEAGIGVGDWALMERVGQRRSRASTGNAVRERLLLLGDCGDVW